MADPLVGFTMDFAAVQREREPDPAEVARGGLGSQCFPVAELGADWDGEPEDGMEYLFTVRREAQSRPRVHRVPNPYEEPEPTSYTPQIPRVRYDRPSEEWKAAFLRKFTALRQRMIVAPARSAFPPPSHNALPLGQDESGWRSFVYGRRIKTVVPPSRATVVSLDRAPKTADEDGDDATMTTSLEDAKAAALASLDLDSPDTPAVAPTSSVSSSTAEALDPDHPAHQPTPALLLTIPAPHLTRILGHFDDWLQERVEAHELALAYTPSTIFAPTSVRRKAASSRIPTAPVAAPAKPSPPPPAPRPPLPTLHESHWILSILSRVDSLLMGDDISTLRQLAKTLTSLAEDSDKAQRDREKIRGGTAGRSMEEKLLDEEEAEGRAHCWMIVAAISSVWAQSDLWQQ